MDPITLLNTLHLAERLKDTTRHCFTSGGRHESVAEHSWRSALMAYLMKDQFPTADMSKVMLMCIIHDLGEIFTGDIPSFYKTSADEKKETDLLNQWIESLPSPYQTELADLFQEMQALETTEAKIFKAIDGMEAVMQHNESDLSTWIPREYQLNRVYCQDRVQFSDYLTRFRKLLAEETDQKIAAADSAE